MSQAPHRYVNEVFYYHDEFARDISALPGNEIVLRDIARGLGGADVSDAVFAAGVYDIVTPGNARRWNQTERSWVRMVGGASLLYLNGIQSLAITSSNRVDTRAKLAESFSSIWSGDRTAAPKLPGNVRSVDVLGRAIHRLLEESRGARVEDPAKNYAKTVRSFSEIAFESLNGMTRAEHVIRMRYLGAMKGQLAFDVVGIATGNRDPYALITARHIGRYREFARQANMNRGDPQRRALTRELCVQEANEAISEALRMGSRTQKDHVRDIALLTPLP